MMAELLSLAPPTIAVGDLIIPAGISPISSPFSDQQATRLHHPSPPLPSPSPPLLTPTGSDPWPAIVTNFRRG